jgi:AbrB family looped-hinge helix DNA binding protein
MWGMVLAQSKVTAQGQISVPAAIRRRLNIQPGSTLEWEAGPDSTVILRRSGRYSNEDLHRALVGRRPAPKRSIKDMDEGIRDYIKKRYARH